jgi:hypothetical protein
MFVATSISTSHIKPFVALVVIWWGKIMEFGGDCGDEKLLT